MLQFRELYLASLLLSVLKIMQANTEDDRSTFLYPGKAKSERDLIECGKREVCSILHKRFWFPMEIERFCRCGTNDCSTMWSSSPDNYTMALNNRAQLKFCEPVTDLPYCMENETRYLKVENRTIKSLPDAEGDEYYQIRSKAECYCPPHRYWKDSKRWGNDTSNSHAYRCSELPKCNTDELCGFERVDHYAVYYQCSCPTNHLCVRRNDTQYSVSQMFYTGAAFKAVCTKYTEDVPLNLANNHS